jgi:hypothetical protein
MVYTMFRLDANISVSIICMHQDPAYETSLKTNTQLSKKPFDFILLQTFCRTVLTHDNDISIPL